MKFLRNLIMVLSALFVFWACDDDELVFDHELPALEIKDDLILLEVIVPTNTTDDDQIYIAGEFNGWEEEAEADAAWYLERSTTVDGKWCIYLDPNDFISGTSLADGYHFVSVNQGEERTALNEAVVRTDNYSVGTRTNIYVTQWAAYFASDEEVTVEHEGSCVIYVVNNTSWEEYACYIWGDGEIFGTWPGKVPDGQETINGVTFDYFDVSDDALGYSANLIFNNNGNGTQLADYNITISSGNFYIEITDEGATEYELPSGVEHAGTYVIYAINNTSWDEYACYIWGTAEIFGTWPGKVPDGQETIGGVTFDYFDITDDAIGYSANVIFNNNSNGSQLADYSYTINQNVYLVLTDDGVEEYSFSDDDEEEDDGGDDASSVEDASNCEIYTIYVVDQTGWDSIYCYSYGIDNAEFGSWPGTAGTEVTVDGTTYMSFTTSDPVVLGGTINLIFNNGKSDDTAVQLSDYAVVMNKNHYLTVTASGVTAIEGVYDARNIWVADETSWSAIALYSWNTAGNEYFGGWPGALPTGNYVTLNGLTYKQFTLPVEALNGKELNLILNNNNGGTQTGDYKIASSSDHDYYLHVDDTLTTTEIDPQNPTGDAE